MIKKLSTVFLMIFVFNNYILLMGCSSSKNKTEDPLEKVMNPEPKKKEGDDKVSDLRVEMLKDVARTAGFRAAMVERSKKLDQVLEKRAEQLDVMFQFAPLINNKGLIPPVIVEAQEVSSFSTDQLRTSDKVYNIRIPERFVSVPPTWRDYLYLGLPIKSSGKVEDFATIPTDKIEKKIWQKAVKQGWEEGEKQADQILEANFNRLVRDYTGMIRYSILLQKNMLTKPNVIENSQVVSGSDTELMINNKQRRLTNKSKFHINNELWKPALSTKNNKLVDKTEASKSNGSVTIKTVVIPKH